jgi:uncharacterized protein (DUF58 family)
MAWASARDLPPKNERAALITLALAALLLRADERVALLGGGRRPASGKSVLERLALTIEQRPAGAEGLPPPEPLPRHATLVLIGDFLSPLDDLRARIGHYVRQGVRGHLLQVLDPAEEDLPFAGRVRFSGLERESDLVVSRVETIRDAYRARLAQHRAALAADARGAGWSFATHRTDHAPQAALLGLWTTLSSGVGVGGMAR